MEDNQLMQLDSQQQQQQEEDSSLMDQLLLLRGNMNLSPSFLSEDAPPSVPRGEQDSDVEEEVAVQVAVPAGYGWSLVADQRRPYNRPVGISASVNTVTYIEKEEIGQGAFGVVYKAVEEKNPAKFVAIKKMKSARHGMGNSSRCVQGNQDT